MSQRCSRPCESSRRSADAWRDSCTYRAPPLLVKVNSLSFVRRFDPACRAALSFNPTLCRDVRKFYISSRHCNCYKKIILIKKNCFKLTSIRKFQNINLKNSIGPKGAKALATALTGNSTMTALNLELVFET